MLADELLLKALEALGANQNTRVRARARNQIRQYLEEYAPDLLEGRAAEGASEPAQPLRPRPFNYAEGDADYTYVALRQKLMNAEHYHRLVPESARYFEKFRHYIARNDDVEFQRILWNLIRGLSPEALQPRLNVINPLSATGRKIRQIQEG